MEVGFAFVTQATTETKKPGLGIATLGQPQGQYSCFSELPGLGFSPSPGERLFLNLAPHYWDSETGENDSFAGKGHTNQVSRMTVDESGQLVSCSMDDTVRYTNLTLRDYR